MFDTFMRYCDGNENKEADRIIIIFSKMTLKRMRSNGQVFYEDEGMKIEYNEIDREECKEASMADAWFIGRHLETR